MLGDITSISAAGATAVVLVVGMVTIAVVTVLFVLLSLFAAIRFVLVDIDSGTTGCGGRGIAFRLEREVRLAVGSRGTVAAAGVEGIRICTFVVFIGRDGRGVCPKRSWSSVTVQLV